MDGVGGETAFRQEIDNLKELNLHPNLEKALNYDAIMVYLESEYEKAQTDI